MKKYILPCLLFITISLFALTSCTREYICQCTISYSGSPGLPEEEPKEYPIRDSKKNARTICQSNSKTYDVDGYKTVEECDLW